MQGFPNVRGTHTNFFLAMIDVKIRSLKQFIDLKISIKNRYFNRIVDYKGEVKHFEQKKKKKGKLVKQWQTLFSVCPSIFKLSLCRIKVFFFILKIINVTWEDILVISVLYVIKFHKSKYEMRKKTRLRCWYELVIVNK